MPSVKEAYIALATGGFYFLQDIYLNLRNNLKNMDKIIHEKTFGTTIRMAWPAILESFFISFAGLVDSFMVSMMGSNAVAAVGLTTQPKFVGLSFFFALNLAVSALVARRLGEKDRKSANQILVTAFAIVITVAVCFSILFVTLSSSLMRACGSTPETHSLAVIYLKIVMGGMIFNCIQMVINAAQRGAGNTKITMRTNIVSNLVNIVFNYLLIGGRLGFPKLGIHGAALATVLGTVVACIMSIISICHKNVFVSLPYIIEEKIHFTLKAFSQIVHLGYSVFLEQILMRIGFVLTALMAANQGNYAMAAHQVGMNLLGLSFSFGDGLQSTAVALIGRSLGENKPDLARKYGVTCHKIGSGITVVLALIYFLMGRPLFRMFFREPEIVEIGVGIARMMIVIIIFQISQVVYMGCLRGAGDTGYTAFASTISVTVIRTVGSYLFGYILGFGIIGIWAGILCDQLSRFIFGYVRFRQGNWTKIKI